MQDVSSQSAAGEAHLQGVASRVFNKELVVNLKGAEREGVHLPDVTDWQVTLSQHLHVPCIMIIWHI